MNQSFNTLAGAVTPLSFTDAGESLAGSVAIAERAPTAERFRPAAPTAASPAGSSMPSGPRMPPLPEIGSDEHVYAHLARDADRRGDRHARVAAKVGLYVTLARNPRMGWHEKLRHFQHALTKHCHVEPKADPRVRLYYHALAHLVREHCGAEALRLASHEDDVYAARISIGIARADIEREAKRFFDDLIGDGKTCPEHMLQEDFTMIRMIRDQWC